MTRLRQRVLRNERGSALVEFAVVCFLLMMVLMGVVEIARLLLVYNTISNAARVGARFAVVHGSDNSASVSTIQGVVNGYLGAGGVNTTTASVYVNYPDTGSCTAPGCRVTVSVSYPYDPFTSYFPISVSLGSTSQGVITF
jgi:Flp pilus assembly protein TadG